MAAPEINLDDRRFEDLVADIRRRIPGYTPEWTDVNDSDPGIALVQVFAWLAETILWRVNRVPEKSLDRFLRLVGVAPTPATPARVHLTFTVADTLDRAQLVRQGTQVSAGSDADGKPIIFETEADLWAVNVTVDAMQVYDGAQFDLVSTSDNARHFFPFGETPRRGAAWYVGLSAAFPSGRHTLTVFTGGAAPGEQEGAVGERHETPPPPAQTVWEYWAGDKLGWRPLPIITDDTNALTQTGTVLFDAPPGTMPMAVAVEPVGLVPADQPLYWLRLRVVDLLGVGYEIAPRVENVLPNTVAAVNAVTIIDELVGTSDGTPNQQFTLAKTPVVPNTLSLAVRESLDEDFLPWTIVPDLATSTRTDRHCTVDHGTGVIRFGDGLHGRIPPLLTDRRNAAPGRGDAPIANIRASRYRAGGGLAGNVGPDSATSLQTAVPFIESVTNTRPAVGGQDAESFEQASARAPLEIRTRSRAVTAADFEFLARQTPGAHVRRAKALPNHHPELEPRRPAGAGQPVTQVPVPGVVTVLVLPESESRQPVIRDETLDLVRRHLARHSLITTELYVDRPRFRKVEIDVRVVARADASLGAVGKALEERLLTYFHPLTGGLEPSTLDQERGWPFGGTIFFSDTYRQILTVPGVLRVDADDLKTFLDDIEQPRCEDLSLRADEIVYSESHRVAVRYE
jgi:predicted phage baseplate assembly protein